MRCGCPHSTPPAGGRVNVQLVVQCQQSHQVARLRKMKEENWNTIYLAIVHLMKRMPIYRITMAWRMWRWLQTGLNATSNGTIYANYYGKGKILIFVCDDHRLLKLAHIKNDLELSVSFNLVKNLSGVFWRTEGSHFVSTVIAISII